MSVLRDWKEMHYDDDDLEDEIFENADWLRDDYDKEYEELEEAFGD